MKKSRETLEKNPSLTNELLIFHIFGLEYITKKQLK